MEIEQHVSNLEMLVRRLCRRLDHHGHRLDEVKFQAMDYLDRHGTKGSFLRAEPAAAPQDGGTKDA